MFALIEYKMLQIPEISNEPLAYNSGGVNYRIVVNIHFIYHKARVYNFPAISTTTTIFIGWSEFIF